MKDEKSEMFVELFDEETDDGAILEPIVEKKVVVRCQFHSVATCSSFYVFFFFFL